MLVTKLPKDYLKKKAGLERLLQSYVALPASSPEKNTLYIKLTQSIFDPGIVDRADFISEDHPLRKEAQCIMDAFESVTNGMFNPDAFLKLESIGKDSVFYAWKFLIYSLNNFYKGNFDKAVQWVKHIPASTAPAHLCDLILKLCHKQKELSGHTESKEELLSLLIQQDSYYTSIVQQLDDALENDAADVFIDTVSLLLKDLHLMNKPLAQRCALWSLKTANDYDLAVSSLIANVRSIFGQAEGTRLIALSLVDEDPDISLLFWIRSLNAHLMNHSLDRCECAEFLCLIAEILSSIKDFEIDEHYENSLRELTAKLAAEIQTHFANIDIDFPEQISPAFFYRLASSIDPELYIETVSEDRQTDSPALTPLNETVQETVKSKKESAVQLELF